MRKSDVTCPVCQAGYRRIELTSRPGDRGEFHCLICDGVLEILDGSTAVALRLTVQPSSVGRQPPSVGRMG
jgi:transposase-like protein